MNAPVKYYDLSQFRRKVGVGAVGPQIVSNNTCRSDGVRLQDNEASCYRFKEYPMGLGQDAVPAGATVTVTVSPQIQFKGDRIMVPSNIGESFDVLDIRVGKTSQLPTSEQPIDAIAFSEVSQGACVDMDTAPANSNVSMTVRNKSGVAVDFRAVIFGVAVDS